MELFQAQSPLRIRYLSQKRIQTQLISPSREVQTLRISLASMVTESSQ
jgi:hypothetical protein